MGAMNRSFKAAVAVLAIVASACGGGAAEGDGVASLEGDSPSVSAPATTQPPDVEEALFAFTECMRDNGIPMSDPSMGPDGQLRPGRPIMEDGQQQDEVFRRSLEVAREECASFLETITLGFEGFDDTEFQDSMLAFAECLRSEGIDVADPDFSEGAIRRGPAIFGDEFDPTDPETLAAIEVCQDELPGAFTGGPGGSPPAGSNG
jgi:hypothetical protein